MEPTELSEVEGIESIADKAIGTNQVIVLTNLQMVPWARQLQITQPHNVPSTRGMAHWGYIEEEFLPRIQRYFPERMQSSVEYALGDALKNALEEAEKIGLKEIVVENSPLGVLPVEFLVHSGVRAVSPHFVKYWKYHKPQFLYLVSCILCLVSSLQNPC